MFNVEDFKNFFNREIADVRGNKIKIWHLVVFIILIALIIGITINKNGEKFSSTQQMPKSCGVRGVDPAAKPQLKNVPRRNSNDYESLVFDNTTGAIMSGSQFMENTGIISPPWVPPAWNPDAQGPSSKGDLNPDDFEDDPRMLYNKCSLSCCSAQYPTPFQSDVDPFVCSERGKKRFKSSDYVCQNNTGGIGCLCVTDNQIKGMRKGYAN